MQISKNKYGLLTILTILAIACSTQYTIISNRDVSFLYNPGNMAIHPEFLVYHHTDTTSLLFLKLFTPELLFKRYKDETDAISKIKIHFRLLNSLSDQKFVDSSSIVLSLYRNKVSKEYIHQIPFKALEGGKYQMDIYIHDLQRNKYSQNFIEINKTSINSRQNFLIKEKKFGKPVFRNYLNSETDYMIECIRQNPKTFYVKYSDKEFPPAPPPFAKRYEQQVTFKTDSIIVLKPQEENSIQFNDTGFYLIQTDTTRQNGRLVMHFYNAFPKVNKPPQLLKPLQYLNSSDEFQKLRSYSNPKIAVDSFWLSCAGNIDRAKEMIRVFYNRLQLSNYYFTSHKQGWKTDRGMIYSVFGAPRVVYRSDHDEVWTYGERSNLVSYEFTFVKMDTLFSINNYVLDRSEVYSKSWFRAVDAWRSGIVYSVND